MDRPESPFEFIASLFRPYATVWKILLATWTLCVVLDRIVAVVPQDGPRYYYLPDFKMDGYAFAVPIDRPLSQLSVWDDGDTTEIAARVRRLGQSDAAGHSETHLSFCGEHLGSDPPRRSATSAYLSLNGGPPLTSWAGLTPDVHFSVRDPQPQIPIS